MDVSRYVDGIRAAFQLIVVRINQDLHDACRLVIFCSSDLCGVQPHELRVRLYPAFLVVAKTGQGRRGICSLYHGQFVVDWVVALWRPNEWKRRDDLLLIDVDNQVFDETCLLWAPERLDEAVKDLNIEGYVLFVLQPQREGSKVPVKSDLEVSNLVLFVYRLDIVQRSFIEIVLLISSFTIEYLFGSVISIVALRVNVDKQVATARVKWIRACWVGRMPLLIIELAHEEGTVLCKQVFG